MAQPPLSRNGLDRTRSIDHCEGNPAKRAVMAGDDNLVDENEHRGKLLDDGRLQLPNPHLRNMCTDTLYHLSLCTGTHDFKEMFGDVKFVCMGGTPKRMEDFARFMKHELGIKLPTGSDLYDISHHSYRYCMYKIGPVLSVSHGMGAPSLSILMHEILKLIQYAECQDPILIRIGTSGGVGIPPGSVVVSNKIVNGLLKEDLELHILGQVVHRTPRLDEKLAEVIVNIGKRQFPGLNIIAGKTMSTNDFYEGQARLDGAFCDYREAVKMEYMQLLKSHGVTNIEMEAVMFASMCHQSGLRGAIICVTLLDRLQGDQINASKEQLLEWQEKPQQLTAAYIKTELGLMQAD